MSTQKIKNAIVALVDRFIPEARATAFKHLDVGAGQGGLITALEKNFAFTSQACDYHIDRFALSHVPAVQVDFDNAPLPYADDSFDFVTCIEVVEHLENYRHLLREAYRVLKPGGLFIVTTPNVLNMKSRLRSLLTGFPSMFGPLSVKTENKYSTGGHITPIPFFYLAHGLLDAGFISLHTIADNVQKSSVISLLFLWPVLMVGFPWFWIYESRKKHITAENSCFVRSSLSWSLLTARTVIVAGIKPPVR